MTYLQKQLDDLRVRAKLVAITRQIEHDKTAAKTKLRQRQQLDYACLIRTYIESLPPAIRVRRWRVDDFTHLFPARWRNGATASRSLIGAALRSLGFISRRDWTNAGRNTRYWEVPENLKGDK